MNNPVDTFAASQINGNDWKQKKQKRFEQSAVLKLLREFEPSAGFAKQAKTLAGEDFGTSWFNYVYADFPISVYTFKAYRTIPVSKLLKKPENTKIYDEFLEAQDNSGGGEAALIFASDGDDMTEMVMHNALSLPLPTVSWSAMLPDIRCRLDSLKGFCSAIRETGWEIKEYHG